MNANADGRKPLGEFPAQRSSPGNKYPYTPTKTGAHL